MGRYEVNGRVFDIPDERLEEFLSKFPNAVKVDTQQTAPAEQKSESSIKRFKVGERVFDIPQDRQEEFLSKFGERAKEITTDPSSAPAEEDDKILNPFKSFSKSFGSTFSGLDDSIINGIGIAGASASKVMAEAQGKISSFFGGDDSGNYLLDNPFMREGKKDSLKKLVELGDIKAKETKGVTKDVREVIDDDGFIENTVDAVNLIAGFVGDAVPQLAASILTLGMGGFGQMVDESYTGAIREKAKVTGKTTDEVIEEGLDQEALIFAGAVAGTVLESFGAKGVAKEAVKNVVRRGVKDQIRSRAKKVLTSGAVGEGLTESAQGVINEITTAIETDQNVFRDGADEFLINRVNEFIGGAAGGQAIASTSNILGSLNNKLRNKNVSNDSTETNTEDDSTTDEATNTKQATQQDELVEDDFIRVFGEERGKRLFSPLNDLSDVSLQEMKSKLSESTNLSDRDTAILEEVNKEINKRGLSIEDTPDSIQEQIDELNSRRESLTDILGDQADTNSIDTEIVALNERKTAIQADLDNKAAIETELNEIQPKIDQIDSLLESEPEDSPNREALTNRLSELQDRQNALRSNNTQTGTNFSQTAQNVPDKVAYDFDDTLYDNSTGQLADTPQSKQFRDDVANGKDVSIVSARENTPENRKFIADQLGIPESKVQLVGPDNQNQKKAEVLDNLGIPRDNFIDIDTDKQSGVRAAQDKIIDVQIQEQLSKVPEKSQATIDDTYNSEDVKILDDNQLATEEFSVINKPITPEQRSRFTEIQQEKVRRKNQDTAITENTAEAAGISERSIDDLEKQQSSLEDSKSPEDKKLFNDIDTELQNREWRSVLNESLDNIPTVVDALAEKDKTLPNGFGSYIEAQDRRETKAVAKKYTGDVSKAEAKKDFKKAFLGNPDTWYADGLKLRESARAFLEQGGTFKELLIGVQKKFESDGFSEQDAAGVINSRLEDIKRTNTPTQKTPTSSQKATVKPKSDAAKKTTKPSETKTTASKANNNNDTVKADLGKLRKSIIDGDIANNVLTKLYGHFSSGFANTRGVGLAPLSKLNKEGTLIDPKVSVRTGVDSAGTRFYALGRGPYLGKDGRGGRLIEVSAGIQVPKGSENLVNEQAIYEALNEAAKEIFGPVLVQNKDGIEVLGDYNDIRMSDSDINKLIETKIKENINKVVPSPNNVDTKPKSGTKSQSLSTKNKVSASKTTQNDPVKAKNDAPALEDTAVPSEIMDIVNSKDTQSAIDKLKGICTKRK